MKSHKAGKKKSQRVDMEMQNKTDECRSGQRRSKSNEEKLNKNWNVAEELNHNLDHQVDASLSVRSLVLGK